jgi:hypothetical protein
MGLNKTFSCHSPPWNQSNKSFKIELVKSYKRVTNSKITAVTKHTCNYGLVIVNLTLYQICAKLRQDHRHLILVWKISNSMSMDKRQHILAAISVQTYFTSYLNYRKEF